MNIKRIIKHLSIGHAAMRRTFPLAALDRIERTIAEVEQTHAGQTARERAIEVFSNLRVWDTEHNNGVLVYLLLADRDVEIVADRGIHVRLGPAVWETVCQEMESTFRQGKFEEGVIAGIQRVGAHLALHYPHTGSNKNNELPDKPVLI
jgi:uncharacterized membrane protein